MANYKQTDVSGTSYQRSSRVVVDNPYGGVPVINFVEEKVFILDASTSVTQQAGNVTAMFTSATANTEFPLLNADDGTTIDVATFNQVRNILYSLYVFLAGRRDGTSE